MAPLRPRVPFRRFIAVTHKNQPSPSMSGRVQHITNYCQETPQNGKVTRIYLYTVIHVDISRNTSAMLHIGKRTKAQRTEQQVSATYLKSQIAATARARKRSWS